MARILAVDDEPSIRKLVSTTLTARGHEVITADNGVEAVAMATTEKPDIIVLDVMMPGMTGLEARTKIRATPATAKIPIVFLSAVGEFEKQLEGMQSDIEDYMTKPFKPSELADHIDAMLDPSKKEELLKEHRHQQAKLRTMVDIMHRDRD